MDRFQLLFLGGSGLLVLVQSIRGWRLGVARQLVNIVALVIGYCVALYCGRLAAPVFRALGFMDILASVLVGTVCCAAVYHGLKTIGALIFRRTGDQTTRLLRLVYGLGGSGLGALSAFLTVWLCVIAIHCLGTVAEAEVRMARTPEALRASITASPVAVEFAQFKHSLESGPTGAVLKDTDPVPQRVSEILNKIAQVISNGDSMQRFVTYPGTRVLSENPKIAALRTDPQITEQVAHRDFMGLLGNPKIAAAVNDPSVAGLVRSFELEKALDYALADAPKSGPGKN